jgi:hypothetical protein
MVSLIAFKIRKMGHMVNFVFDGEALSPLQEKPQLKEPPAGLRTLEPGAQA